MEHLIKPHGGKLCNLLVNEERVEELKKDSIGFKSWNLPPHQLCDLELLLCGAFSPLTGFLGEEDYNAVTEGLHLADGTLWPVPVTLDISAEFAETLSQGDSVALRDPEGFVIAIITVESLWRPGSREEMERISGTTFREQVSADHLFREKEEFCIGGSVEGLRLPRHHDFTERRLTPFELRRVFAEKGWRRIIACQTKETVHRAYKEMTQRLAETHDANLLIQAVATLPDHAGIDHYSWVRCCRALTNHYPPNMAMLNLLPLVMHSGSPEEILWHAIISKNFGCTHFMVDEEKVLSVENLFKEHEADLGIEMIAAQPVVYVAEKKDFYPAEGIPVGCTAKKLSQEELARSLEEGREIPDWFTYPEVAEELGKTRKPRSRQGFTLFFTGLSGSGKSSAANIVRSKLLEMGGRNVTLLDGDLVRKNLSSELNFSKEHRDINILRIGFVANEITKNGGIAVCCPIAPYAKMRDYNRKLISKSGGYIEIFIDTPIDECERRDTKGLYAKARAGILKGMTGIDDPYETPESPEIRLNTMEMTPEEAANEVLLYLEREGYLT